MGIAARSRDYNITRQYNDSFVKTTTIIEGGSTSTGQTAVSDVGQYLTRSGKNSGKFITVGNRRIATPTDYQLVIFDRSHGMKTTTTGRRLNTNKPIYRTEIVEDVAGFDTNVVANTSGKFSNRVINFDGDAYNQSVTECRNRLGDQKASIGAALAEARSTFNMLADTSVALLKSYRAIRRGNWAESARYLGLRPSQYLTGKSSASGLLQIKYGWLPLMHDLKTGYDWFASNQDTPLLINASATARRAFSGSDKYDSYTAMGWSGSSMSRCHIVATVDQPGRRVANQGGLLNPLSIAWEVVPYSFVLDWWMPVGNVLQAYSDTAGLTFRSGYTAQVSEGEVFYDISGRRETATSVVDYEGGGTLDRYYRFRRTKLGSFPIPGIYQKQNWFNKSRAITALALFRQLFR